MGAPNFSRKKPWHLWVVGVLSLLWNAMGAFDYLATKLPIKSYMAQFTPEQLAFFNGFPLWVNATWAIAVWFSVLGSLLLLLRKRIALPVFWLSLSAMMATAFHNFGLSEVSMSEIAGTGAVAFSAVIFIVSALLVWYVARLKRLGILN